MFYSVVTDFVATARLSIYDTQPYRNGCVKHAFEHLPASIFLS